MKLSERHETALGFARHSVNIAKLSMTNNIQLWLLLDSPIHPSDSSLNCAAHRNMSCTQMEITRFKYLGRLNPAMNIIPGEMRHRQRQQRHPQFLIWPKNR